MELLIIQYSLAVVLGAFLTSIPFRIVLILRDSPKTLWIYNVNKRPWKKLF
jgi:hypothetical protein